MSVFEDWTCIFPGKMGLSWKSAWNGSGTKEVAEIVAGKNCNVIAVPVQLFTHLRDMEKRVVVAENKLQEFGLRIDYDENMEPKFVSFRNPNFFKE